MAGEKSDEAGIPFNSEKGPAPTGSSAPPPHHDDPAPAYDESDTAGIPSITAPFHFPAESELPPYSAAAEASSSAPGGSSSSPHMKPIAIPQAQPDPTAAFVTAYAPTLLNYGITEETWRPFLETVSAFLTAKVSDKAVSHAADVARSIGDAPKSFGKHVGSHVKSVGKNIATQAKKGNIIGAAFGVVGGAISIPVSTTLTAVGTVLSMPGHTVGALTKKPQTPYQRAVAYVSVANKKWLEVRGLRALVMPTAELAQYLDVSSATFLESTHEDTGFDAANQLRSLEAYISALVVEEKAKLDLGVETLWLVLVPLVAEETINVESGKEKRDRKDKGKEKS